MLQEDSISYYKGQRRSKSARKVTNPQRAKIYLYHQAETYLESLELNKWHWIHDIDEAFRREVIELLVYGILWLRDPGRIFKRFNNSTYFRYVKVLEDEEFKRFVLIEIFSKGNAKEC